MKQCTPLWRDQGVQFIHSISKLLELLLDYRSVIDGEENRDKRMSCTVNLLRFYKEDVNRSEMYIRYIYKLCDLHIPAENYTEAAFTLKLHADSLSWTRNLLPPASAPPASAPADHNSHHNNGQSAGLAVPAVGETECQLKERLYLSIIEYFDKGKCWEEGIPLIKELANFYEKSSFDYAKLSSILVSALFPAADSTRALIISCTVCLCPCEARLVPVLPLIYMYVPFFSLPSFFCLINFPSCSSFPPSSS